MARCAACAAAHWESNRRRAETEQGFSKASRLQRGSSHHVSNVARLKTPTGVDGAEGIEGSAEHSGDSAFERPQGVLYEDSSPVGFQPALQLCRMNGLH